MGGRVNYGGLVIAAIGFFLTRFTVTLAAYEAPVRFYLAGVVPLALGLGLAAFGVALAVADVEASLVRTTATWCVAGTGAMLVLVLLTLLGSTPGSLPDVATVRSRTALSNFLIGGSVGGTLTGLYAARNRRHRAELRQQANRLEVLNRLLRHEILNAVTAIRGYAGLVGGDHDARAVIEDRSDAIERTIEEVRYLARSARGDGIGEEAIDPGEHLAASVASVRDRYPDADISVDVPAEVPAVLANERLDQVFSQLLENAVVHSSAGTPAVGVSVTATPTAVRIAVRDEGPGLPESRRDLLETGDIGTFDDPRMGYGLNVVRLLVESYRGTIETDVDEDGTTVTVGLQRADPAPAGIRSSPRTLTGIRPSLPHLAVTLGAAVIAGVPYGIAAERLGGSVAAIGVFYGIGDPVVGWLTHEFHSAVFAFVFAGLLSMIPERYRGSALVSVGVALAWSVVLWVVAAGIVAPLWLRLLGFPAAVPTFSPVSLVSHLLWGLTLGVLTVWGYARVTPWLARRIEPLGLGPGTAREPPPGRS